MRQCSKPRCSNTAAVILGFSYAERTAVLEDAPSGPISPHVYAFCQACSDSLTTPRGWELQDRRSRPPLFIEENRTPPQAAQIPPLAEPLELAFMGAPRSDN